MAEKVCLVVLKVVMGRDELTTPLPKVIAN
jgi:hypothetical protein